MHAVGRQVGVRAAVLEWPSRSPDGSCLFTLSATGGSHKGGRRGARYTLEEVKEKAGEVVRGIESGGVEEVVASS